MSEKWFGINREEINWFPIIDYDKCIGCMACMDNCSNNVFVEKNGKPFVKNPKNCVIGCVGCEKVCPQQAITHPPKEYLVKLTKHKDFKSSCGCSSGCGCGGK